MFRAIDRIDVPADVKANLRSLLDYFDCLAVIFKEVNNHQEEQAAEVLRGNVAPNGPSAGFQAVQQRRLDLRQRFDDFLETDFTSDQFRSECYKYLGRMANLLGINPQTRRQRRDARAEERARLLAIAALRRIEEEPPAESGPEDNNPSDQSEHEREQPSSDKTSGGSDEENLFE
ncbi:hypothetical protein AAVH_11241 [Aphelenchoides avenae]|nr:hypothetical protein AAVH_11241 [Aphelenchus avenae]